MRVILASTSPRRRELLALLGLPFEVQVPAFDEQITTGLPVADLTLEFARGKARAVARLAPDAVVIGSDTLIELDQEALGKPETIADARAMLERRHPEGLHVPGKQAIANALIASFAGAD